MFTRSIPLTLICMCCLTWSDARADKVDVGDKAPPVAFEQFIQGEPIELGDGKHIHVLEFWTTWCPPCRISIPHLNKLHLAYKDKDVILVGITPEDASKVQSFVTQQGDKMTYPVAIDDKMQTTTAYGIRGIPHSVVVDRDGKVAWRGHPMDRLDEVLDGMLAKGELDQAAGEPVQSQSTAAVTTSATATQDNPQARAAYAERLQQHYFQLVAQPEMPDPNRTREVGYRYVRAAGDDHAALTQFTLRILNDERILHRDLDMALHAARQAHENGGEQDSRALDAHAQALFANGHADLAVEQGRAAVELCEDEELRPSLEANLKRFEEAG